MAIGCAQIPSILWDCSPEASPKCCSPSRASGLSSVRKCETLSMSDCQGLVPFSPTSEFRRKAWRSGLQHFDLPGDLIFLSWPFVTCCVCRTFGTFTGKSFPRSWTGKCYHLVFIQSHKTRDGRDHSPPSTSPDLESKP